MAVTGESIGIIKMTAAADAVAKKMKIDFIRWVGAAAADDELILTDTAGNTIFESIANAGNFIDIHTIPVVVDGIIAATLDSGTLYIYKNADVKDA